MNDSSLELADITGKNITTLHIDTSVQIERCKGTETAGSVERVIKDFKFKTTSTYAKLEFKRAWLQRLAYLHSASFKVERDDQLLEYVNKKLGAHPAHRRMMSTCLQAIISFLLQINGPLTPQARLLRLRSHIRSSVLGAHTWWTEYSVEHEFDGTGCIRAQEKPTERGGVLDVSIPKCNRSNINCSIHQFFSENLDVFLYIKSRIEALGQSASDELKRANEIISKSMDDPTHLCNTKICAAIGDVIIAVDGIKMGCFAANNDKEWVFLANVLSKKLINPVKG